MPREDKMTVDERRKYLKLVAPRYVRAGRGERSRLLSEMASVTGLHRKSLLRLLHAPTLERVNSRVKNLLGLDHITLKGYCQGDEALHC